MIDNTILKDNTFLTNKTKENQGEENIYIIGISGPTSAGKTYFTRELKRYCDINDVSYSTISTDDFYLDLSHIPMEERKLINYDDPASISKYDLLNTLSQLRDGKSAKIFHYSFKKHVRTEKYRIIRPTDLLIIEGIFSFSFNEMLNLYDLKIYVDLDTDLRLIRRILRDSRERGRSLQTTIDQYLDTIRPTQERFVKKDKNLADIILTGDREHNKILDLIVSYIKSRN